MEDFLQETAHLKLKALDEAQLNIISACVQDSLVPLSGMHFDPAKKSFKLLLNRFQWEREPIFSPAETFYMRTHTSLIFENVSHVDYRGITADHSVKMLNILMLYAGKPGFIHLLCSEGAIIRLHSPAIYCYLEDISESWVTEQKPNHLQNVA